MYSIFFFYANIFSTKVSISIQNLEQDPEPKVSISIQILEQDPDPPASGFLFRSRHF